MFNTYFTRYGNDVDVPGSDAYNILSKAYEENSNIDSIAGFISVSGKVMNGVDQKFSLKKDDPFYFEKVFYFSEINNLIL